jgi:hypothetical protein
LILVKNATLTVYPGGSHGLADTHKDQRNADLLEFLKTRVCSWRLLNEHATLYQGFSFHPSTKPMPKHHSATTAGRSRVYC